MPIVRLPYVNCNMFGTVPGYEYRNACVCVCFKALPLLQAQEDNLQGNGTPEQQQLQQQLRRQALQFHQQLLSQVSGQWFVLERGKMGGVCLR